MKEPRPKGNRKLIMCRLSPCAIQIINAYARGKDITQVAALEKIIYKFEPKDFKMSGEKG